MDTTMDTLEIIVESESRKAIKSVDSLINKLKDLNKQLSKIGDNSSNFEKLKTNINGAKKTSFKAGTRTGVVPKEKPYVDKEIATQMANLGKSFKGYDISKTINEDGKSIMTFKNKLGETITVTEKYNDEVSKIKVTARSANQGTNALSTGLKKLKASGLATKLAIAGVVSILVKGAKAIAGLVSRAGGYTESINLFTVTMGNYAQQGLEWIEMFSNALYLDPANVMQYMGSFNSLIKGLGVGADASYLMSQNLTQLTYDLASFKNLDFDTSYQKLMSAISGEIEPLRNVGVALGENTLQYTLNSLGIEANVRDLNEAQKAQLRYIQIMRSSTEWQTDMGATLMSPTNALRIIKQEFIQLGRAVGNIFIPIVMTAIPYVMALTQILMELANKIAGVVSKIFGIKIDFSAMDRTTTSLGNISSGITDIGDSAKDTTKKLNTMLAPFDDLNAVQNQTEKAGGGVGGIGAGAGDLGVDLPTYDALANLTDKLRKNTEKAKKQLKSLIPIITAIGGAFLTWKIAKSIFSSFLKLSDITNKLDNTAKGVNKVGTSINKIGFTKLLYYMTRITGGLVGLTTGLIGANGVYKSMLKVGKQSKITGGDLLILSGNIAETTAGFSLLGYAIGGLKYGPLGAAIGAVTGLVIAGISAWAGYKKAIEEVAKESLFGDINISVDEFSNSLNKLKFSYTDTGIVVDEFKGKLEPLVEEYDKNSRAVTNYLGKFKYLGESLQGDTGQAFISSIESLFANANNIVSTSGQYSLDLWTSIFSGMKDVSQEEGAETLNIIQSNNKYVASEMSRIQGEITAIKDRAVAERRGLNNQELLDIQALMNEMDSFTKSSMTSTQADIEYFKKLAANKNLQLDEESYSNYQNARKKYQQEQKDIIQKNYTETYLDAQKQIDLLEKQMKTANESEKKELQSKIDNFKAKQNDAYNTRVKSEKELQKELQKTDNAIYDDLKKHYQKIYNKTDKESKAQKKLIKDIFKDANIDTKPLENQFRNAGSMCARTFGEEFNRKQLTLNAQPNAKLGFDGGQIKFTARTYETGGYPESGELFFMNENGVAEMQGRIGNKSAVVNNNQIASALATSLDPLLANYFSNTGDKRVSKTIVYIGNSKIYEGYGDYIEDENDRYGTNTIRI